VSGWPSIELASAARVLRGVSFGAADATPDQRPGSIACLTTAAVKAEPQWGTARYVPSSLVKDEQLLRPGDILVSTSNSAETVGRSCLISSVPEIATFGAFVTVARPDPDVLDPRFLAAWMRSGTYQAAIDRLKTRTTNISNLRSSDLGRLRVPLPPLDEQRRIAARLREQLSEVARLQMSIARRIDSARVTAEALVEAAFRAQSPGVTLTGVGAVATIQTGYAFKSSWFRPNGVRLLRNANVLPDEVDWSDTARLDPTLEGSFPAYALAPGDIVLALDRPVIAAGLKVARLGEQDTPSLLLQRVARLRPGPKIDADYLYAFMHTQRFRSAMSGHSQSLGVPHVSPRQVASVPIPLPPLDEQRQIAARLHEQLAEIDRAKAALNAQRRAVDALPAALLREVFGPAPRAS